MNGDFWLKLRERGPSEFVSLRDWRLHGLDLPMKELAAKKVVRLARSSAGFLVTPGNFIGELSLPTAMVSIEAKSPDVVAAMDKLALLSKERHAFNQISQRDNDGSIRGDPIGEFRDALMGCVYEGLPWTYVMETSVTSFPRGRIEFGKTIRNLATKGVRHRVVATRPVHRQKAPFNRVINSVIHLLPKLKGSTPSVLGEVQILRQALDTSEGFDTIDEALVEACQCKSEMDAAGNVSASRLLDCSIQILENEHFTAGWVAHLPGGIARFRNIEALWERCTHVLVGSWLESSELPAKSLFHGLRGKNVSLFRDGGPLLDPDAVINVGDQVIGIADAKYKILESMDSSASTDLYQMACYVRCLNARFGVLVHLTEAEEYAKLIGTTCEDAPIITISVSDKLLLREGSAALSSLLASWPDVRDCLDKSLAHGFPQKWRNGVANLSSDILLRA